MVLPLSWSYVTFLRMELLLQMLVVVRNTVIIYVFLILMFRIFGKRQTSEVGLVELIVIMMLGSAVETSLINGNRTLLAGVVSATTLFLCNLGFSFLLKHWNWLQHVLIGEPVLLVSNGQFLPRQIQSAGLTEDDVLKGIRERGYEKVEQVKMAIIEIDGEISIIPQKPKMDSAG